MTFVGMQCVGVLVGFDLLFAISPVEIREQPRLNHASLACSFAGFTPMPIRNATSLCRK